MLPPFTFVLLQAQRRCLAISIARRVIWPGDRLGGELSASAQPASTNTVKAFAVTAYPVAAADICSPASCLVPTMHDAARSYLVSEPMLVTRTATATVRLVDPIQIAVGAGRGTLRWIVSRLFFGGRRFAHHQMACCQRGHAGEDRAA